MELANRHIVVTGGTGALGVAVVSALTQAGAICHVPYHKHAEADQLLHHENARVQFAGPVNLSDESDVARIYAAVPELWASVHLAGGFAAASIDETDKAALMRQVESNLVTSFLCCRAAVKAMIANGVGGRIVNVAARPALEWRTGAGMTAYTASKAAVAALTTALSEEVAGKGILVNAIAPSIMDTPANRRAMPKANHAAWPKVEEVALMIAFLVSPANSVGRGGVIPVYGRS